MNFYDREREIALGERSKLDPPEPTNPPEIEYYPCDNCHKGMEYDDHYRNSGLCYSCIMAIGKIPEGAILKIQQELKDDLGI